MCKRRLTMCVLMAMLGASGIGMAEETAPQTAQEAPNQPVEGAQEMSLSMEQAVSYAIEHNRTLANASLEIQKAEMQRWQTIAGMLLNVDGNLSYTNMCGYEMDYMGGKMAFPPYGQLSLTASIGVNGQGIIGAQLKRLAKELQTISCQQSEQTTKYQVESTYTTILAMEETVRLLEQNMENLDKMKAMTENAVKVGAAEQNTADQIAIQVATMKSTVNKTNQAIETLYNSLLLQLGADFNTHITLTQKLDEVLNEEAITTLLATDFVMEDNYNYQMLKKSTEIVNKQKSLAVAAFFPTLSVAYQMAKKKYFEETSKFDMTPPNTVQVGLSVPIFSSGKRTTAVKEAKIAQMEQENTIKETEVGLMVQEKQLRYSLTSAYDNYMIQKENIRVMNNVFNSYSEKFKYGSASSMDLTNSSTQLVQAQTNYVNSVMDVVNAQIELKKLLNK